MSFAKKKIKEEILNILRSGKYENGIFYLPQIQLDRKIYLEVNKVLENAGGKWNRKAEGHIFQLDPSKLWKAIEIGETVDEKKLYQFFETPKEIARQIIKLADIRDEMTILEPSAGHGAILEELDKSLDIGLVCIEIDPEKCKVLEEKGYQVECGNFLDYSEEKCGMDIKFCLSDFDRIIMNPPFTKGQDADHVLHAYDLLADGGRLVSIMSWSVTFNQQGRYKKVRELIEKDGEIIELDDEVFKESGTKIKTCLVIINKVINR